MIRTTAVPRPVRVGIAAASVVGVVALAGCAAGAADAGGDDTTPSTASTPASTPAATETDAATGDAAATSTYADGTYTAEGSYQTPESVETITVTVTLESDVITSVEVTGNPQKSESKQYQSEFIGGIADVVVGKDIDEISVSRVSGSSLTSNGFNAAIEEIKTEAAA
ncbi:MAG: hypothetical protein DI566_01245 [Microbacterium sp.]|nr:MAG: hypothetical protein DI566_01245 [Microbacterium sp.]